MYSILISTIFAQIIVITKFRTAINVNKRDDVIFRVIISHHIWVCGFLLYDMQKFITSYSIFLYTEVMGVILNFLIALFIWRWIKT